MLGIKKTLLCAGGLMVAAGGPVTMFSASDFATSAKQQWFAGSTVQQEQDNSAISGVKPVDVHPSLASNAVQPSAAHLDIGPMPGIDEVLRFDLTVESIMRRWPRVSTGLPYLQLQGYRVPLMTGTNVTDLAGALTYYYNAGQQLQRITFRGTTGDPSMLVALLTSRYHFTRRLTNDPGWVIYETVSSKDEPAGTLKIRSAQVIKANQPLTRFEVDLVMDRT